MGEIQTQCDTKYPNHFLANFGHATVCREKITNDWMSKIWSNSLLSGTMLSFLKIPKINLKKYFSQNVYL